MELKSALETANAQLAAQGSGLRIEQRGQRLNLRGSLPLRGDPSRNGLQRISLGLMADAAGLNQVLGIGGLDDILHGVSCGYDTFDCVSPTRIARHGIMLSRLNPKGVNLNNSKFKNDHSLIDEGCELSDINNFTKAYLHHHAAQAVVQPLGADRKSSMAQPRPLGVQGVVLPA